MNYYEYEELDLGHKELFSIVIEEENMNAFRKITSDENRLHTDCKYAMEKGYSGQIAFGMLVASYLSTMAGVYLPGERSLIHSVQVKFLKPVYLKDRLDIEGTIVDKNDLFKILTLKIIMTNQNNIKVCKAEMKVAVI